MAIPNLDDGTQHQIDSCINLFKNILGEDLRGIYLYGSAVTNGLQRYSDIDLLVVSDRNITNSDREELVQHLLSISGVYKKSDKRSIEATFLNINMIIPWHYPPVFNFQYGEWLREHFERGELEPWSNYVMPDLAILITQVLFNHKVLYGQEAKKLLPQIPKKDLFQAMFDDLELLCSEIRNDTTNVLLTLSRIWTSLESGKIESKSDAANQILSKLPKQYQPMIERAKSIYQGGAEDSWVGLLEEAQACSSYMAKVINEYKLKAD